MVSSPVSPTLLAILASAAAVVLVLDLSAPWTAHAFSTTAAIAIRPGSSSSSPAAVVARYTSLHSWNPNNSNSGGSGGFSPNGSSRSSSSSNNNYNNNNGNDRRDAGRFSPRGDARRDGMGDSNRRDGNINGNVNGNGSSSSSNSNNNSNNNDRRDEARPLVLYGHPGSRSPMVRWAAYELGIGNLLREGDLRDNPHPFGKIPCLTDDGGEVGVFESGAILQYLHNKYFDADYEYDYDDDDYDDDDDEYENGNKRKNDSSNSNSLSSFLTGGAGTNGSSNRKTGTSGVGGSVGLNGLNGLNDLFNINSNKKTPRKLSASKEAALASWVVWANASLEPICFVPDTDSSNNMSSNRRRDGDVTGLRPHETGLKRRTGLDDIDRLDEILENVSRRPDAGRTTNGISNSGGGPSSSTSVSSSNSGALTSSASAYLLGQDVFTVADVAVSSYLLFALRFYPDTDFTRWPNIMRYMAQCVSRDAYGRAFGRDVQQMLLDLLVVMNGGRPFETGNDRRLGRKNGNRINSNSRNSRGGGPSSLVLYGHPSSQSPIVSWAAYELDLDVPMGDLSRNPHPFGRIPCLTDDDGKIKVFETGAILQYLQDNYGDRRFDRKGGNNNKWDRVGRLNGDRPNGSDRMDNDVGRGDRRTNNNNNDRDRNRERERWEFGNKRESVDGKEYSAQVNSWVVWANAELEPICCYVDEEEYDNRLDRPGRQPQRPPQSQPKRFTQPLQRRPEQAQIERMSPPVPPPPPPRMGRRDTGFYNRPGRNRAYDELEQLNILLGQKKEMQQKERAGRGPRRDGFNDDDDNIVYLVGDDFSLADVAVASYLLYIPQNFPGTDLSQWPHLVDYMRYCADRPGYAAAFGPDLQAFVLDELDHFDPRFRIDGDDEDRFGGPPPPPGPRGVATGPRGREGYPKDRSMMSPRGVDRGNGGGWDRRGQNGMVGEPNGLRTTPPPIGQRRPGGVGSNDPLRDPRGAPPDPNGWTGPNGLGRIGPDGLRDDDDDNYRGGRQLFSPSFRR